MTGGAHLSVIADTAQQAIRDARSPSAAAGNLFRTRGVDIDLEPYPAASIRIRYEFTPQLVKLGVLPSVSPLERRERARGFGYCPEP